MPTPDCTVREPFKSFILSRNTKSTQDDYRLRLNVLSEWMDSNDRTYLTITPKDLTEYLSALSGSNKPTSVAHHAHVISSFFKYLVATEQIDKNPTIFFSEIHLARRRPTPRPLDDLTRNRLLKGLKYGNAQEIRCSLVVLMGLLEGLRIGEIAALEWDRISFDTDEINLIGKGQKERTMPMHPTVRAALWKLKEAQRTLFTTRPNQYVFQYPNYAGHPSRSALSRWFYEARSWTPGLPPFTPHALRHTFGTMLANAGRSVYEIRDLMGHSSIFMSEIYVQNTQKKTAIAYKEAFGL